MNTTEVKAYLSEVDNRNAASVFVHEEFKARCLIAHSAYDLADFLRPDNLRLMEAEISNGQYRGDSPMEDVPSLSWIGREEGIEGVPAEELTESRIATELGAYRKKDIELMVKFRDDALRQVSEIDLSDFIERMEEVDSLPAVVDAFGLLNGEAWAHRRTRTNAPKESIALVLPLSASWTVDAETLAAAMAVVVAVSEALSEAGFNLELWVANRGRNVYQGDVPNGFFAYKVKDTDDPFNDTLTSSAASCWFFRTGIFSLMKACGPQDVKGSLGIPDVTYTEEEKSQVIDMLGLNQGHVMAGWAAGSITPAKAMKHMVSEISNALLNYTEGGGV